MKKLTAGIFSVLMGLVSVNAAEAAVASKAYVDTKIGDTGNKTVVELINGVSSGSTEATTALAGRVTTAESEITTLKGDETKEGSVAKKIADAIGGLSAASVGAEGSFISTVSQADGTVAAGATPFVAEINNTTKTSTVAPQTAAVAAYVDGKISQIDEDLTDELNPIRQSITDLGAADTALDGRVGALETDNTTNKADIDALQAAVNTLNGDGDGSIAKQIETVTADVTRVETEYKAADTALGTRVGALETDNTTNKADITAIKTEQATQNSDIGTLKETVAKLDGNGEGSIAKQIETVTQQVTQVVTDYKAADATLTQAITNGDADTLEAAQGYADQAELDAIATAGENADAKITKLNLAALSRVPVDCQDPDAFCVLTAKGGMFYWEAIERAAGEEQPAGTAIPPVTQ